MRSLALVALLATGCAETIYGDGQLIEHTFEHDGFLAVETDGVNLKVTASQRPEVVLVADWNVFPHVSLSVEDDTLLVELEDGITVYPTQLEVRVSARTLDSIAHRGGADLLATGLRQPALAVTAEGNGTTELIGDVDSLSLTVESGAGVRNAQDLLADEVIIDAYTSGSMWVTAAERISGTLYGKGQLIVLGKPEASDIDVQGEGQVVYR